MLNWFNSQNRINYAKGSLTLRRSSDNATRTFTDVDRVQITQWLNGSVGYIVTLYDLGSNKVDIGQWQESKQPIYDTTLEVATFSNNRYLLSARPRGNYYNTQMLIQLGDVENIQPNNGLVAISDNDGRRNDVYLIENNTKIRVFWKGSTSVSKYCNYSLIYPVDGSSFDIQYPETSSGVPVVKQNGSTLTASSILTTSNSAVSRIVLGQINAWEVFNPEYAFHGSLKSVRFIDLNTSTDIFYYEL